jgi:Tfp pilus assembly protein PilP
MMKPQGTIKLQTGKLLTSGMWLGLMLLVAGVGYGMAQTQAQTDVRNVLSQAAQANSSQPATDKTAQTKPATATAPTKPAPAPVKTAQNKPAPAKAAAPQAQARAKTPAPAPATAPKQAGKPAVQSAAKPAPAAAPNSAAPQVTPVAEHSLVARRDPFDPLINKEKETAGPQAPLPAGKPGLVVATLRVDGIVRSPNGMIAVVSNPQMRVYFLREGDHLYDGEVEHITMEGVSFHETGKDAFGKSVERESTKRLYPTPGEQQ